MSGEERFEVIVVGAGPAGSAAAYLLAKNDVKVLLVERGRYPGAKNVSGGIIYSRTVNAIFPEFWTEAPVERAITGYNIALLGRDSSLTLDYRTRGFAQPPYNAFSVLRATFDQWLFKKAEDAGAVTVTGVTVDDIIIEEGRITGIRSGNDEIAADVVIDAGGSRSILVEKAGLRSNLKPEDVSVGVKEVIQLPAETINQRFNIKEDEGAAYTLLGGAQGIAGGGFLYTNRSSISLGIVTRLDSVMEAGVKVYELIEDFRTHPLISQLIDGGDIIEYSAQILPERGRLSKLYTDGFMVTGSAAGLVLNTIFTLRGMDLAIISGAAAARAAILAKSKGDFSAAGLSVYENLLREHFILQDMDTFRHVPDLLDNDRFFTVYPELACDLMESLFGVDNFPRLKASRQLREHMKGKLGLIEGLKDLIGVYRAI